MAVLAVCSRCQRRRPISSGGVCHGCIASAAETARHTARATTTPALLTLLSQDARRCGLEHGELVVVHGESQQGSFELVVQVSLVGHWEE